MKNHKLLPTLGLAFGLAWSAAAQNEAPAAPPATQPVPAAASANSTNQSIRLNFRGVPLEMVLNHLSEAAGFIVLLDTEIKGNVDVWSNQPLNQEEAVQLLNSILNEKGYAAIRNGRLLRIVSRDNAKKRDLPVKSGANPEEIEKSDEMITQIIPVRFANATQMTRDLQPLLDTSYATLTANESGNALVLTDTKSNIRRIAEIVAALDTSISSISSIRVFPLRYADAKELATAVKEVFQLPTANNQNQRNRFFGRGGGGPGAFFGGGGDRGGGGGGNDGVASSDTGNSAAREAASRVTAVADERTNSLIVGAPDEHIPAIEELVQQIDVQANDITELRVFPLKNADPVELATIFGQLFPDETRTSQNNGNNNEFRFGDRGGGGGFRRQNNNANADSARLKKMGKVMAVPDQRTSSLIVSAASELMPQIEQMVLQLDSSSARKQKVYVYSLENADVQQVEQILQGMFQRTTTSQFNNRNNQNQNSALNSRSQQTQTTINGQATSVRSGNNNNTGGRTR